MGGGGQKICARMHISSAKSEDPYGRIHDPLIRPLEGIGFLMFSRADSYV